MANNARGPARVAAAAAARFGEGVLGGFYTAFGEIVFDVWRRPSAQEYRTVIRVALPRAGLSADLESAMDSEDHDTDLRASHDAGVALVGSEVGTPITRIDGSAFLPQFFELKRTRLAPPVFT